MDAAEGPNHPLTSAAKTPLPFNEKLRLHLAWKIGSRYSREIDAQRAHTLVDKPGAAIAVSAGEPSPLVTALPEIGHRVFPVVFDGES
jgi:hypothetical protein